MKKNTALAFALSSALYLLSAQLAYAQMWCPPGWESLCNIKLEGGNLTGNILTIIIILSAVGSLVFLIIGGIKWVTSGGDKAKIAQARSTIIAALVGLVISLLAYFIVSVIFQIFTGQQMGPMTVPKLVQ